MGRAEAQPQEVLKETTEDPQKSQPSGYNSVFGGVVGAPVEHPDFSHQP
jgi:hypothetical protein